MDLDELAGLLLSGSAVEAGLAREELRRREDEVKEAAAERRRWN